MPPPQSIDGYQVGVVCALPKDMMAIRAMLDQEHEPLQLQDRQDSNSYVLGELHRHRIVIACLPAGESGTSAAAKVAGDMLRTFTKIRFGLVVGVGGGIPPLADREQIRLGDVVVSQPEGVYGGVIQHDLGKVLSSGRFERKSFLNRPPTLLLTALSIFQTIPHSSQRRMADNIARMLAQPDMAKAGYTFPGVDQDHLFCTACDWSPWQLWWWMLLLLSWLHPSWGCSECDRGRILRSPERVTPQVHFGTIASGNCLVMNAAYRDRLRDAYGAKCVEMVAAGLMNNFPCLIICGICNYADAHRNDRWEKYAAVAAIAFVKELLSIVTPMAQDTHADAVDNINNSDSTSQYHMQVTNRPYDDVEHWFEQKPQLPQVRLRGEDENDRTHDAIDLMIDQRTENLTIDCPLSTQHQEKP